MEISYADKVYKMLMEFKGEFSIEKNVRPENRDEFIRVVKQFISDKHIHLDYDIQIKSDYTAVRRV